MTNARTVLLVDDSENDLFLLRLAFKKARFEIGLQECHDGEEAIKYLAGDEPYTDRAVYPLPAAMLLDLNMPRKNGFDVLSWVRGRSDFSRITIIIITASLRVEDVERAYASGANQFLVKPGTLDGLVSMIVSLRDWLAICQFPPGNEMVNR